MKRKVCVITGSRAEYGLLRWLMHEIEDDQDLELQIIATGTHLSHEFGLTYREIEADGFKIDKKIEMLLSSDSSVGIIKSMGLGLIGFADALDTIKPEVIVVLGDRFEILVAAQAAMMMNIPIAHISGGEITEGVVDDRIRNALTKLSDFHFPANEDYQKRIMQMGENPNFVLNFGDPGLDSLVRLELMSKEKLEADLDFKFGKINFLVTFDLIYSYNFLSNLSFLF
jgi:UDP-N-acetylglucosamine 2-epimerase (non-hydrolysing)/GDP/UDP-N,N'-diacetylbacillosamine 2-epimerase (hydrolysing)